MRQIIRTVLVAIALVMAATHVAGQTQTRQVGSTAWRQFRWPQYRLGRCLETDSHVVCLGNDGTVGVYRRTTSSDDPLNISMRPVSEQTITGLQREFGDESLVDAQVTEHAVWALYKDNRRQEDGVVRWDRTFYRIDLEDPRRPEIRRYRPSSDLQATSFAVHGNTIYTDAWGRGVQVLRVEGRGTLTHVRDLRLGSEVFNVTLHDGRLYAVVRNTGIASLDLSIPEEPRVTAVADTGRSWSVAWSETTGYVVTNTGIAVVDQTADGALTVTGQVRWEYIGDAPGWAIPMGDRLAVFRRTPYARDRIEVYDVSDPTAPALQEEIPQYGAEHPLRVGESDTVITPAGIAYNFAASQESPGDTPISGTITIPGTSYWNPDSGTINIGRAGLKWEIEDATARALVPRMGFGVSLLGSVEFRDVTEGDVRRSDPDNEPIPFSIYDRDLRPGLVFGIALPDGRYGAAVITTLYSSQAEDFPSYTLTRPDWRRLLSSGQSRRAYHLGIRYLIWP